MPSQNVCFNINCICILTRTRSHQIGRVPMMIHQPANESSVPVWSRARCSFIRAWASYLYYVYYTNNDDEDGTTKTECKCKSEIAYVVPPVSFFFSVDINPCPERIYFYVAKEFQRIIIRFKYSNIWNFTACMVNVIFLDNSTSIFRLEISKEN
mgnify:CR=1 FL=1